MLDGKTRELFPAGGEQMHLDLTSVHRARLPFDKAGLLAARDECDDAMRLSLESFRDFADGRPLAVREALGVQHQLVLQDGDAFVPCSVLTESQKAAQPESEIRKRLETLFFCGALWIRHGRCAE